MAYAGCRVRFRDEAARGFSFLRPARLCHKPLYSESEFFVAATPRIFEALDCRDSGNNRQKHLFEFEPSTFPPRGVASDPPELKHSLHRQAPAATGTAFN